MNDLNMRSGELPPTYEEVLYWKVTQKIWRVILMNLLSLPLAVVFGGLFLVVVLIVGEPFQVKSVRPGRELILFLVGILLVGPLHELAHGIAMMTFGAKPRYGIMWMGLMLYATAPGYAFKRGQYLVVSLAPLVSLTLLACLGILIFAGTTIVWIMAFCGVINGGGTIGDLWISAIVLRYPSHAYVVDERDGIRIFLPPKENQLSHSREA